ncbi:MAG: HAD family hydrolase [Synergistaceae bacterium]|nr:HAD family hydrolase [Synergistaceae bacterium]
MTITKPFWHPSNSKAFILDWDGVLAETKLDFSDIRKRYYGGRKALLLEEASTLTESDRKSLMKDLRELEMAGTERATAVPGAIELTEKLYSQKIPFCIVSRNTTESIEAVAKKIGIKLPEHVFGRDNSTNIKPDPRSFLLAAEKMRVLPKDCVAIGDFLYDLQCARRAGVRAVLVQRDEPEWEEWADVSFPTLLDFIKDFEDPTPIVPWEYREIHAKRGDKWMNSAKELILTLPEKVSPNLDCWLCRAAALGIDAIHVPSDAIFSVTDWKESQSFSPKYMGRPMSEVIQHFLATRYPMVRVVTAPEVEGLRSPKNSLDLMRFLERKIF